MVKGFVKAARSGKAELDITTSAHTEATLERLTASFPEAHTTTDNSLAIKDSEIVILAVKPWLIDGVLDEIKPALKDEQMVISVAANVRNPRIDVYAMPNIAAEFGQSMTFIERTEDPEKAEAAEKLMSLLGKAKIVEQRQMAAGMMMAGCGIAYVMRMVRAMMEGGVEMGFYPKDAQQIAMQTMQGAVTLLEETGLHPEAAIDKVTTPGGVTIKGLNELDHAGFNSAVIRCLKAGL